MLADQAIVQSSQRAETQLRARPDDSRMRRNLTTIGRTRSNCLRKGLGVATVGNGQTGMLETSLR